MPAAARPEPRVVGGVGKGGTKEVESRDVPMMLWEGEGLQGKSQWQEPAVTFPKVALSPSSGRTTLRARQCRGLGDAGRWGTHQLLGATALLGELGGPAVLPGHLLPHLGGHRPARDTGQGR